MVNHSHLPVTVPHALPSDYEECADCGFDHEYEPSEAQRWHAEVDPIGNELSAALDEEFSYRDEE